MHRLGASALAVATVVASFSVVGTITTSAVPANGATSAATNAATNAATSDGVVVYSIGDQFANGGDLSKHSDIFSVGADGTHRRQLTHVGLSATAALPALSSDGREIVYESNATGNYEIWAMHADGTQQHQVTRDATYDDLVPRWSPDGQWIVFSRCDTPFGFPALCDLDVIRADGTGRRRVVGGNRYHQSASFSPDGKRIAFGSDRAGLLGAIWVVNVDGSGLRQVTHASIEAFAPDWSPDGTRIMFTDNCCRAHSNLWTIRPDGTKLQRITNTGANHNEFFGSFGPDGRGFVTVSDAAYGDSCCVDLVLQRADGTRIVLVKNPPDVVLANWGRSAGGGSGAAPEGVAASSATSPRRVAVSHLGVPTVSVAGSTPQASSSAKSLAKSVAKSVGGRIAFADYNTHQLYAVDPSGSHLVQLTHTDDVHSAADPDWSPDGQHIAYTIRDQVGAGQLWIANADGHNAHRIPGEATGYRDHQPRFTRDGHIVFSRCQPGDGVCAIWIMRADGTQRRAITSFRVGQDEAIDFDPAVSPDGKHVAFTRFNWRGITAQVRTVNIDGTHDASLTPAWLEATGASFSPDGSVVTVTSQAPRLGSNIYSVTVANRHFRRLTFTAYPNNDLNSVFSPDGARIAFVSDRRYDDFCCQDLFTMRPDGSGVARVSTGALQGVATIAWGAALPAPTATPERTDFRRSVAGGLAAVRTASLPPGMKFGATKFHR